jgi:fatty acid desaturase
MFINDPIFGVIVLAWAMLVNRILAERALKRLSTEQKAKLLDSFSRHRTNSIVVVFVLLLIFFIVGRVSPSSYPVLAWGFLGLLVLMSIVTTFLSHRKLKRMSTPKDYINNFLVRCVIYYAGIGVLLFTLVRRLLPR